MKSNIFFAFLLSFSLHGALVFLPFNFPDRVPIEAAVQKGPSSVEVSLVETVPPVLAETEKLNEEETRLTEERIDTAEKVTEYVDSEKREEKVEEPTPMSDIGAITEEVSSLLINKPPIYPKLARIKGWEGTLVLIAEVGGNGKVRDVWVFSSSGYQILDDAGKKAVRAWHFKNAPAGSEIKIPIRFVLTRN